jgi:hypothetical protein
MADSCILPSGKRPKLLLLTHPGTILLMQADKPLLMFSPQPPFHPLYLP